MSNDSEITIVKYLYRRLHELGVRSVHGVPGDFNLVALDFLQEEKLNWVGNCNELNAAYACDGYARVNGIGALITTFGVGELSALAGIAGSYSEYVPVVHIVGVPSTSSQAQGELLHHTLGNGDFNVFARMSRDISQAMAQIVDPETAAKDIDKALQACYVRARPVYITLPTDMVLKKISAARLKTPIDLTEAPNVEDVEADCISSISKLIYEAKNAVILADACAVRHRVVPELHELIEKSQLPAFSTPMSKSAIDETNPRYGGVYVGDCSRPEVKDAVEGADLILSIGALKSDFNSGGFTYHLSQKDTIEFHSTYMRVGYSYYQDVKMKHVLRKLLDNLDWSKIRHSESAKAAPPDLQNDLPAEEQKSGSEEITHAWLWPRIGQWFRKGDVIVTETGTSNFGIIESKFPADVTALSQVLWGSIGFATPCTQGAALACKDLGKDRRVVLFTGEGSLQLTAQEISTMIRHDLKPILFVINNEGYTIERLIHGEDAGYNDVAPWKYTELLKTFGAQDGKFKTYTVRTKQELDDLLDKDKTFSNAPYIQLVELFMPKMDAPRGLKIVTKSTADRNSKE